MSGRADDLRLTFAAEIGRAVRLGVDNIVRQTDDDAGAMPPGKYLVEAVGLGANTMQVKAVPFVGGQTEALAISAPPVAGATDVVDGINLSAASPSFMLHVRAGANDRLVAIMSAGTATLVMTKTGT